MLDLAKVNQDAGVTPLVHWNDSSAVDFCVWVLSQVLLEIEPFCHVGRSDSIQPIEMTDQAWQRWFTWVVLAQDVRLDWIDEQPSRTVERQIEESEAMVREVEQCYPGSRSTVSPSEARDALTRLSHWQQTQYEAAVSEAQARFSHSPNILNALLQRQELQPSQFWCEEVANDRLELLWEEYLEHRECEWLDLPKLDQVYLEIAERHSLSVIQFHVVNDPAAVVLRLGTTAHYVVSRSAIRLPTLPQRLLNPFCFDVPN